MMKLQIADCRLQIGGGGVESRHAVKSSSETPEKTEGIALAEEGPRLPERDEQITGSGVIATAPQIRKAVSACKDSESSASPSLQSAFFNLHSTIYFTEVTT